jgi:hypothetical protein
MTGSSLQPRKKPLKKLAKSTTLKKKIFLFLKTKMYWILGSLLVFSLSQLWDGLTLMKKILKHFSLIRF